MDDRWWVLELEADGAGLCADGRPVTGRRPRGGGSEWWSLPADVGGGEIALPVTFLRAMRQQLDDDPGSPPAVFVRPPDAVRALQWIAGLRRVFADADLPRV